MQLRWNHARPAVTPKGRKTKPEPGCLSEPTGLEAKEPLSFSGRGRKMSLTSPLIDQALYTNDATLRPVVPHRRFGLALHIRSLPASRTALPLPRTHNKEIFAAGATSPQVGFADGFLGFSLKLAPISPFPPSSTSFYLRFREMESPSTG